MAHIWRRERRQQRGLARIQRAVSGTRQRSGREGLSRRVSNRQAGIPGGQRYAGAGSGRKSPEAVN